MAEENEYGVAHRNQLRAQGKRMTPAKARRAIDAIVAVLECEEVTGSDQVKLEDARAVLAQWDED